MSRSTVLVKKKLSLATKIVLQLQEDAWTEQANIYIYMYVLLCIS